jgi:hypothetical protein
MSIQCLLKKCLGERDGKTFHSFVGEREGEGRSLRPKGKEILKNPWRDRRIDNPFPHKNLAANC